MGVKRWQVVTWRTVKGKRYGPYYAEQWRTPDGVLHTEYKGKGTAEDWAERDARKAERLIARGSALMARVPVAKPQGPRPGQGYYPDEFCEE
jgi:hypothetical protein